MSWNAINLPLFHFQASLSSRPNH